MASIKIPTTPSTAYDPKRPANALLLTQVRELEKALSKAGRRVRRKTPKTEAQVAAYIRHLNRAMYHQVLLPPMKRRPLDVPGVAPASRPKRRRAPRKRAAAASTRRKKAPSSRKRKKDRRS